MSKLITELASGRQPRAWLVFVGCLLWLGTACASSPLNGGWRDVQPGDTPATVIKQYNAGLLNSFNPSQLQRFKQTGLGSWVVLAPQPPWDNTRRVLTISPPAEGTVVVYGANQQYTLAKDDFATATEGYGRLAWEVPATRPASQPILLRFEPTTGISTPVRFQMLPWHAFQREAALWLVFASSSFAVMLAMVLMALCFSWMLHDAIYAWYAGYILCYTLIQAIQTGFLLHPLDWQLLSHMALLSGTVLVAASVICAAFFMIRFCDLNRYAPLLRVPILALTVGMTQLVLMRFSHIAVLIEVAQVLLSPLLILGATLLLVAAVVAASRGSRPAWFFLLGWTPLLLLTAMASAQVNGAFPTLYWLNDASLGAGAFEAIVLSLGLADRALTLRRDRDVVRALADHDALTNVLNRRAWTERAALALADASKQPVAMLFLDLDYFKQLNDQQGHHAGDRALVAVAKALAAELRPADILGRYGGEEFVALLADTPADQAMQVATRLCRRVNRLEIPLNEQQLLLSISIGVAMYRDGDDVEALVERADQAMYNAKLGGRNRVCSFDAARPVNIPTRPHLHAVETRRSEP